jgi:hypothetical protein
LKKSACSGRIEVKVIVTILRIYEPNNRQEPPNADEPVTFLSGPDRANVHQIYSGPAGELFELIEALE